MSATHKCNRTYPQQIKCSPSVAIWGSRSCFAIFFILWINNLIIYVFSLDLQPWIHYSSVKKDGLCWWARSWARHFINVGQLGHSSFNSPFRIKEIWCLKQQQLFLSERGGNKWTVRTSWDENLPTLQVSHFRRTACLNAFLSSFLNSYVRELPTERRQAGMNERNGGRGMRRGWKLGHEGEERENKSPSEEDDASWLEKQQGILSPTLPACSYLRISPVALLSPHPPPPPPLSFLSLLCALRRCTAHMCAHCYLLNYGHAHACMRTRLNCWSTSHDETEEPISMLDILLWNSPNWYRQHVVPRQLKTQK